MDVRGNGEAVQAVRKAVIEAKILLSSEETARLDIELPEGKRYLREITREQFEELDCGVIARTAGPCEAGFEGCGTYRSSQIDEVVLVGGSTRIPAVRALVDEICSS